MRGSDLIAATLTVLLLAIYPGPATTSPSTVVFFLALLLLHLFAYALSRRWQPSTMGVPLLRGIRPSAEESWAPTLVLLLLLSLATVVRLSHLGAGLWFDEIGTLVSYVRKPMATIVSSFESRNQHMLYSLAARASFDCFGESAWSVRLPAAVFGVASLWGLDLLGRQLVRRDESLGAVVLLVFAYHHVWFSQNARGYTLLLFLTLVGSALFVRLLANQSSRALVAWSYGLVMALAIFTHATAAMVLFSHGLIWICLLVRNRRQSVSPACVVLPVAGFVLGCSLSVLFYSHSLVQLYQAVTPSRAIVSSNEILLPAPTQPKIELPPPSYVADRSKGVERISRRARWFTQETLSRLASGIPGNWVLLSIVFVCFVAGCLSYGRLGSAQLAVLLAPPLVTCTLLFAADQVMFPRFFFFALGFAVLLVTRGIFAVIEFFLGEHRRWIAQVAIVVAGLFNLGNLGSAWAPKQDFEGARAFIRSHAQPNDAVVTVDMTRMPFLLYFHERWRDVDNSRELESVAAGHPTTWVIYTMSEHLHAIHPEIWTELQAHYRPVASFPSTVNDGAIVVTRSDRGSSAGE